MTEEQFNTLPDNLQIWALRENKVLYVSFGIAPSTSSDFVAQRGLELGKHYPHILRKYELRNYNSVEIVTLDNNQ